MDEIAAWMVGRLPQEWFEEAPSVSVDREEIVVLGRVPAPETEDGATPEAVTSAEAGRTGRFREQTRAARMKVADEAEARFARKVAWGVRCGGSEVMFTNAAVPVMTRLRQPQRQVLDTLVEAGVARSRSEALSWCVSLVGQHQEEWITSLRDALVGVQSARASGPQA